MYTIQRIEQQTTDNKENLKFIIYYNPMDYELELKIDALEKENKQLKAQVEFLKEQLTYKMQVVSYQNIVILVQLYLVLYTLM